MDELSPYLIEIDGAKPYWVLASVREAERTIKVFSLMPGCPLKFHSKIAADRVLNSLVEAGIVLWRK